MQHTLSLCLQVNSRTEVKATWAYNGCEEGRLDAPHCWPAGWKKKKAIRHRMTRSALK